MYRAVPPCIARRRVEASGEPPVPVQVQAVVSAAAAARFEPRNKMGTLDSGSGTSN
jgi:hypothetical protein